MRNLTFNFGNEANIIACVEHDDKTITIPAVENSPVFNSMEELAQNYAQARGVKPENFKNWVLLEDGTCYTYVLRAGTAGIRASEMEEEVARVCDAAQTEFPANTLDVVTVFRQVETSANVEDTLINMNTQYPHLHAIIDFVYEAFRTAGCFAVEETVVEEDTRSDFEKFVDNTMETYETVAMIAHVLGLPMTATKEDILASFTDQSDAAMERFSIAYGAAMQALTTYRAGSFEQALLVVAQEPIAAASEDAKNKLIVTTGLAGRTAVNVPLLRVGRTGIISTAKYVTLTELRDEDVYIIDKTNTLIEFDEAVDAELIALAEADDDDRYDDTDYDEDYDEE